MAKFYPAGGGGESVLTVGANLSVYGPDATGDGRGLYSIDIQTKRAHNTQVASGDIAIAIGYGVTATSPNGIAIGVTANAKGGFVNPYLTFQDAIAIGRSAYANGSNAVAIGKEAKAYANNSFAVGSLSKAKAMNCFALGPSANAGYDSGDYGAVAVGAAVNAKEYGSVAIGSSSRTLGNQAVAIGAQAHADIADSIAIGHAANVPANYLTLIGNATYDIRMTDAGVFSMMDWKVRRAPVAGAKTNTHTLSIDLNGVTYYVLLAST